MSDARHIPLGVAEPKRHHLPADFFIRLVREKPMGVVSGVVVLIFLLCGVFSNVLAPYEMSEIHVRDMLSGPSAKYLLGADHLGRDILSQLIYGARISLIVGLGATAIGVVVAIIIGAPSGFLGGKYDIIVQRFVDAWMCFPGLIILLIIMSMVGRGMVQLILILGIFEGIGGSRLIRSAVMAIKENAYFLAAETIGSTAAITMRRHIIPNIMPVVLIIFSVSVGAVILGEAGLSFLGFGLPPDAPSWGGMLSMEGRKYMEIQPMLAIYPGLCLAAVIFSLNMFGDAVRDLLDPRLRGGMGRFGVARKKMKEEVRERGE